MDDPIKFVLNILNQLMSAGILATLVVYVWKNRSIVKFSKKTALELKSSSEAAHKTVELSQRILTEMQELRAIQTSPKVIAFFKRENNYLYFILQNIGNGIAKDLTYGFTPALSGLDIEDVERIIWLGQNEIVVPPNYEFKNYFGRAASYIPEDSENNFLHLPHEFTVNIKCKNAATDEILNFTYKLDLKSPIGTCPA